jgi:hypothetical protein
MASSSKEDPMECPADGNKVISEDKAGEKVVDEEKLPPLSAADFRTYNALSVKMDQFVCDLCFLLIILTSA